MKLLIDTHLLLWAAFDSSEIYFRASSERVSAALYFSSASIWDLAIKSGLHGKILLIHFMDKYGV
jgi:PIN domain nuclease of toxin-antitoxin system